MRPIQKVGYSTKQLVFSLVSATSQCCGTNKRMFWIKRLGIQHSDAPQGPGLSSATEKPPAKDMVGTLMEI